DIKKKLKEVQAKLKDLKKPIRSFRIILGIAIAIAIMWTVNVMGAAFYLRNYQEHLLIGKMQHMQELRTVLQKKGEEINSLKAGYKTDIEALTAQIREEQATKGVKSYADAEKDAAIAYDLSLIQKKQAYISKLDDISHKINSSILEINYLCESIRTDLPMVKTLGKKEIAVLTNRLKAIDQKSLTKTLECLSISSLKLSIFIRRG
ncbi:MAG: hypothetical protein NT116_05045, partial [Candidatus Parcubacteria bacterium]|nr:hypothetical protein [Candidatus Parcubacteria bacterium]